MARIVHEVGPRYVFVENSPLLTKRGLNRVLGDLAAMGYDARWGVLGAVDVGAPHKRDRIWIVAHAERAQANSQRGADQCGRLAVGRDQQTAQREDGSAGADRSDGCCKDVANAENPKRRSGQFGKQNPSVWPQGNDESFGGGENVANASLENVEGQWVSIGIQKERSAASCSSWWATEPDVGRVVNGLAARVDRLKALGNGQVPAVAALAWRILTQ
tara:strand:- start:344 stop:994 length:651 start_codon:yes stop_codon:yes gene_type:complete